MTNQSEMAGPKPIEPIVKAAIVVGTCAGFTVKALKYTGGIALPVIIGKLVDKKFGARFGR
jgi:hypothetical protein